MSDSPIPPDAFEAGCYERMSLAQEYGLVVASMDLPYWIILREGKYVLLVESQHRDVVELALAKYGEEQKGVVASAAAEPMAIPRFPLFCMLFAMLGFEAWQVAFPVWSLALGSADNVKIFEGEWWRIFTALTLHGDLSHFAANLCVGGLFFAFTLGRFGGGAGAFWILLSGGMGNLLNAWFYREGVHNSIGASTAVFGAMGLIIGSGLMDHLIDRARKPLSRIIIPIGGGLALFALLSGSNDSGHIDVMAHVWGLLAGVVIGIVFSRVRLSDLKQKLLGFVAVNIPIVSWFFALR